MHVNYSLLFNIFVPHSLSFFVVLQELEEELKTWQTTIDGLQDSKIKLIIYIVPLSLSLYFVDDVSEFVQEKTLVEVVAVSYEESRPLETDEGDDVNRRCVEAKVSNIPCDVIMMSFNF